MKNNIVAGEFIPEGFPVIIGEDGKLYKANIFNIATADSYSSKPYNKGEVVDES